MRCSCGAQPPDGARWCGRCGARLVPVDGPPPDDAPDDAPDGAPRVAPPDASDGEHVAVEARSAGTRSDAGVGQRRARVDLLVVLVALLALAALLVPRPAPPPEAFLGRLDDATGRSSSAPPPDGQLEQRWSVPLEPPRPGPGEAAVAAGPDHVLVSGVLQQVGDGQGQRPWPDVMAGAPTRARAGGRSWRATC